MPGLKRAQQPGIKPEVDRHDQVFVIAEPVLALVIQQSPGDAEQRPGRLILWEQARRLLSRRRGPRWVTFAEQDMRSDRVCGRIGWLTHQGRIDLCQRLVIAAHG